MYLTPCLPLHDTLPFYGYLHHMQPSLLLYRTYSRGDSCLRSTTSVRCHKQHQHNTVDKPSNNLCAHCLPLPAAIPRRRKQHNANVCAPPLLKTCAHEHHSRLYRRAGTQMDIWPVMRIVVVNIDAYMPAHFTPNALCHCTYGHACEGRMSGLPAFALTTFTCALLVPDTTPSPYLLMPSSSAFVVGYRAVFIRMIHVSAFNYRLLPHLRLPAAYFFRYLRVPVGCCYWSRAL